MRPTPALSWLFVGWTLIALVAVWWPAAGPLWWGYGGLLAVVVLGDVLVLWRTPVPEVERTLPGTLSQGEWCAVGLVVRSTARRRLRLLVHDLHPATFEVAGLPASLLLSPLGEARLDYRLRPVTRGDVVFAGVDLALYSPLGLWRRRQRLVLPERVRVVPALAALRRGVALAAQDARLGAGVHPHQRRGSDGDFHQLRDYRAGDLLRQIDWKASARARRPISREYRESRDQQLVFLLDCGRHMRHLGDGAGHLDAALAALLLVAGLAVRQGDAVGLMSYGGTSRWCPPRQGQPALRRLLDDCYDLQPTLEAADPLLAAATLQQRLRRRALVVLITCGRDEDQEGLEQAARLLGRDHLLLLADLRERSLEDALNQPVRDLSDALRFHALRDWRERRRVRCARLRRRGVQVLDLLPAQLPSALADRYLAIKRAGML
ncbi:DUF58 domain-containing protein [Marichromatium gracile]|uniref:DUF58 domain-containing protein n=1 Tax=Marichromatium gracile TaxID=1048 RepID=A0ABR5VFU3_MARGR|nr:DUF58 domain-containing protein [Marichromatium gracile]KXX64588.1 hypothetical protein AY586_13265 [Marichromatium gracile]